MPVLKAALTRFLFSGANVWRSDVVRWWMKVGLMVSGVIHTAIDFDFDFDKTKAALLYLATHRLPEFDKYKACKLLFLADREHLLRFGRTITGDSYSALPYGPTPDKTLDLLDEFEAVVQEGQDVKTPEAEELVAALRSDGMPYARYDNKVAPDLDALSESDVMILDQVASEHGCKTFQQLYELTHQMSAYKNAWRDDPRRRRFPMCFEDFFAGTGKDAVLQQLIEDQRLRRAFPEPACT